MPVILRSDREKYVNQKELKMIKHGGAIYLPNRKGDGIADLFAKIVSNKEALKTLADLSSTGINSPATLVGTITKAVKDGEDIKSLKLENGLKEKLLSRTGNGFYFA